MINNVHKKFLILSYVCFVVCFNAFSMEQKMEEFKAGCKSTNKDLNRLCVLARELSDNNKKNYRAISLLTHPDKNPEFEEVFKAANESFNKGKSIPEQEATLEEKKLHKILNKTTETKHTIDSLKNHSLPIAALVTRADQIRQEISHSLVDSSIDVSFGLILKNLAPGSINDTNAEKILDDIRDKSTSIDNALDMHADYRKDLQQATARNYTNAQKKLQSLLKKEKK